MIDFSFKNMTREVKRENNFYLFAMWSSALLNVMASVGVLSTRQAVRWCCGGHNCHLLISVSDKKKFVVGFSQLNPGNNLSLAYLKNNLYSSLIETWASYWKSINDRPIYSPAVHCDCWKSLVKVVSDDETRDVCTASLSLIVSLLTRG